MKPKKTEIVFTTRMHEKGSTTCQRYSICQRCSIRWWSECITWIVFMYYIYISGTGRAGRLPESDISFYLRRLDKPPKRRSFNLLTRCDNSSRGTHKSYTQGGLRRRRLSSPHIGCVGAQDDLHEQWEHLGEPTSIGSAKAMTKPKGVSATTQIEGKASNNIAITLL
jgi:hypothetical protein